MTVFPDTLTEAIPGALDCALTAPSPARTAVIVPEGVPLFRVRLWGLRERLPAAFPMAHVTLCGPVPPPDH